MTHLFRSTYLRWVYGAVAVAACLVVVLSVGLTQGHSQSVQLPSPTASYSIFDRAAVAGDTPPTNLNEGAFVSRQVQTGDPGLHQWITLSGDTICVQIDAQVNGSDAQPRACNSTTTLESTQELLILGVGGGPTTSSSLSGDGTESVRGRASDSPPTLLAGLVPNGVSQVIVAFTDGLVQTVTTKDNSFHLYTENRTPTTITWTAANGVRHSE